MKFKHLKNSRFDSTSFIFRDRTSKSKELHNKTLKEFKSPSSSRISPKGKENLLSSISAFISYSSDDSNSSSYLSTPEEETLLHSNKEILGPTNSTLDLPAHKNITERTSGTHKTFSSTHLGASICSKPKVKAAKHAKSFCKTMPTKTLSSTYFSGSTSRTRHPTLLRLVNGEEHLYFFTPVVLTLIILLLLYLFAIQPLHLPFDRGKDSSFALLLK